ncbi:MAG: CHAD domain-containing protein [Candidatus Wallbacteria bacterium]|nr:CHAD domain-containing protein [Candidatus Wallbacteria bacterium]
MNPSQAASSERRLVERSLETLEEWCRKIACGDEEIETIHQARVGSRRFRAALGLFGSVLGESTARELRRMSRNLGRALGLVRDADVFLRHLVRLRPLGDPARAAALRFARNRVRLEREDDLSPMRAEVARFLEASALLPRELHSARAGRPERGAPVPGSMREAIGALLKELIGLEEELLAGGDLAAAHRMRIAAKHLRYAMEMVRGAFPSAKGKTFDAGLSLASNVQGMLGHVQDHHVWNGRLKQMRREVKRLLQDHVLAAALGRLAGAERRGRGRKLRQFLRKWGSERAAEDGTLAALSAQLGPGGRPEG